MKHRPGCRLPDPPCTPPHPDGCGCPVCRQKCGCDRCDRCDRCDQPRFLLPRIIACGRIHQRCARFTLRPAGLPDCLHPPLMLVGASAGCQMPAWELTPGTHPSQACVHVTLPVCCQVRDCSGCTWCGDAWIALDTVIHLGTPLCECWRAGVMVQPCVRMVCAPVCAEDACFEAQLEVEAEVYLVRWEVCAGRRSSPCGRD